MSKSGRWIEKSFLLAGVVCLGVWVWSVVSPAVFQDWESWVFDRKAGGEQSTVIEYVADRSGRIAEEVRTWLGFPAAPEPSMPRSHIGPLGGSPFLDKDGLVGRLTIRRLHLRAMVREGADENTLGLALGHIPGTAFPGQKGNVGVAGHRDTLFRGLREIHKDDTIQFETLAGTYVYQVEDTEVVKPQNVSVLKAREYPELTLVTCYPFNYIGPAPERFIVTARQVPPSQTEQEVAEVTEVTETPQQTAVERKTGIQRVAFEVSKDHSQQVSPGISLGVTGIEPAHLRVNGWLWLMPDRRTIWLRDQSAREPVIFYGYVDGKRRELLITSITTNSVKGYLVIPEDRMNATASGPRSHPKT